MWFYFEFSFIYRQLFLFILSLKFQLVNIKNLCVRKT